MSLQKDWLWVRFPAAHTESLDSGLFPPVNALGKTQYEREWQFNQDITDAEDSEFASGDGPMKAVPVGIRSVCTPVTVAPRNSEAYCALSYHGRRKAPQAVSKT